MITQDEAVNNIPIYSEIFGLGADTHYVSRIECGKLFLMSDTLEDDGFFMLHNLDPIYDANNNLIELNSIYYSLRLGKTLSEEQIFHAALIGNIESTRSKDEDEI